ncbi:MAG: isoprenoid biosynthesis glyoxalase ElbB [Alphaproteobacteria bacterium]|nr:isoprenoid biosynthesis glyoxalase ElbB [Alphaproteobacteria bacterium]MBR1649497.1 isoprenoid biosynthesis glyoxalase ElbB [Alphaproteobacteria bacterium]
MKVAVVLSGCGLFDGSEIHESVLTLLNLDKQGVQYQCFAPNIEQARVVNHFTREEQENEVRNVLVESARIARGNIYDLRDFNVIDFDAVIFPGGRGAVSNLCDFGEHGASCEIHPEIARVLEDCFESRMPIGAICIAPAMIACVLGQYGIKLTIGNDEKVASVLEKAGAKHQVCTAFDAVVDEKNLIVSTPAYMLARSVKEVDAGIARLVEEIIRLKHSLDENL